MHYLLSFNQKTEKFLFWATALTSGVFFIMICLNVIARYLLNAPIMGSVEISRLAFVWSAFLASALCYRKKSHIAITYFADRLPARFSHILALVVYLITCLFFMVLFFYSIDVAYVLRNTSFPVMQLSQTWLYAPIPVLSFFIIFFCLEELILEIRTLKTLT
ncbi:MAG: TRAP transporter small permease [Candidatus Cyclobacteriaceae bacterium M3_2C_046]